MPLRRPASPRLKSLLPRPVLPPRLGVGRSAGKNDRVPTRSHFRAGDIAKGACAPRLLPEEAHRLQQHAVDGVNGWKSEGLLGTCLGMFLVLADARIGARCAPPKIGCRRFCRTRLRPPPSGPPIKNPARGRAFYWRTERDSNPRTAFTVTHFPGVRLQPLGHLSCQGEGGIHAPGVTRKRRPSSCSERLFAL